jgi:hypothetical protein
MKVVTLGWTHSLMEESFGENEGSWELKRLETRGMECYVTAGFCVDGRN